MPTNFPTGVDNFTNPTANDSLNLPSHSTQHANANDAIEAVEAYLLTGQAWLSYTPTLSGITLGNGSVSAAYSKIGKNVTLRFFVQLGTTSVITGDTSISLPVTGRAGVQNTSIGFASIGAITWVQGIIVTSAAAFMRPVNAGSSYAYNFFNSAIIPDTWGNGNQLYFTATYEAV